MNTSEKYTSVLIALADVQERMIVEPDGENKHLKAKYATLDNILKTVKPILKEKGLVVLQDTMEKEKSIICVTRVCHAESGEWIESSSTVPIERSSAQGVGSSTTYGRRYSLCTALGIGMNNDDDGSAAEKALEKAQAKEDEANRLQKIRGIVADRLCKYDIELSVIAFGESGYISEEDDETLKLKELIEQVNTSEKLTTIGLRVKELSESDK